MTELAKFITALIATLIFIAIWLTGAMHTKKIERKSLQDYKRVCEIKRDKYD